MDGESGKSPNEKQTILATNRKILHTVNKLDIAMTKFMENLFVHCCGISHPNQAKEPRRLLNINLSSSSFIAL
jgi:hypothetical protein